MNELRRVLFVSLIAAAALGCSFGKNNDCISIPDTNYRGNINNTTMGIGASTNVSLKQSECQLTGIMLIDRPLIGSGPISGSIIQDKVYFKIDKRDSDAGVDIVFTGTVSEGGMKGTYHIPERSQSGGWDLVSEAQ